MGSRCRHLYDGFFCCLLYLCYSNKQKSFSYERCFATFKFYRTVGLCKIFVSLFISVFTGSLTFTAYSTIEYSIQLGERTESLFLFMWPFYFILALGMGLMSLVACLQFIEDIHSYIKGDHFTAEVEVATDV